jgi:hypothetical protein
MVKSASASSMFAAKTSTAFNARLPGLPHFGVYAGHDEGAPDAKQGAEFATGAWLVSAHAVPMPSVTISTPRSTSHFDDVRQAGNERAFGH